MADLDDHISQQAMSDRPRYRQPIGMPLRDEGTRAGALVSIVVHAVIIFLLIVPFFMPRNVIQRMQQGAGGPGQERPIPLALAEFGVWPAAGPAGWRFARWRGPERRCGGTPCLFFQ